MSQNRSNRGQQPEAVSTPIAMEVMRQASEAGTKAAEEKQKPEENMPLFWRVFGGTVLSITSLVVMTAYNGLTGSVAGAKSDAAQLGQEVRKELTRLGEVQAVLIPKDEFATQMSVAWRSLNELKDDHKELVELREKCQGLLAAFKAGDAQRRQLEHQLQSIREEQAADLQRKALADELGRLRERLATLEGKAVKVRRMNAVDGD